MSTDMNLKQGCLLTRIENNSLWITLNRPEKRNAMNDEMLVRLLSILRTAANSPEVRNIVVEGAGSYFSSGRDLRNLVHEPETRPRLDEEYSDANIDHFYTFLTCLLDFPKPTIAAVKGYAIGGAQALTLACDFVIAEKAAKFGNIEITNGYPAAMNIVLLQRHLGPRLALEIAVTGTLRSAVEYHSYGLINRICEEGELDNKVKEFLADLDRTPWSVRKTKELMRKLEGSPLETSMHIGAQLNRLMLLNGSFSTPKATEKYPI